MNEKEEAVVCRLIEISGGGIRAGEDILTNSVNLYEA